ncbi:hypothetical protein ALC60_06537 [Trachymyrmex zeteki]|uniref:Uncharacterized protein n=1 Tax=Mycetomoellerius zeteki TaxID=64791 RepID=A0A151X2H2_9HYME|nr:hypothetical protein ALC60_06537 [Trachymyrmex zeteki]
MFAPVSPRHGESRKCIEAAEEGERAKNSTEAEQIRKSSQRREHTIANRGKEKMAERETLIRCSLFILVKSRNEKERSRKKENEEGISRKEIREMMSPSASTPSAAFRTKRVAKNLPPLVHDDDRERRLHG